MKIPVFEGFSIMQYHGAHSENASKTINAPIGSSFR